MKEQELSIIIPIYNGQNYIFDCLSSILRQKDSSQHEIIIVNDGSTDNTENILCNIAKENKNIHIINQKNSGVSVARNNGILASHGKYITFIDCDDMVGLNVAAFDKYFLLCESIRKIKNFSTTKSFKYPYCFASRHFTNDYFENMLHAARDTKADIVFGGKISINMNMAYSTRQIYEYDLLYGKDFEEKNTVMRHAHLRESANFALYRREMINKNNLYFLPNMNLDEDILFCMLAVLYAERIATVKDVTYFYNRHENTLSNMSNYFETINKSCVAYIQRFSYLLNAMGQKPEYSKMFNYWMKYYSKKGFEYPCEEGEFPPDNCHYWCTKYDCTNCNIAKNMRENFVKNIKKYCSNTK